jgi:hypothetical protein
MQGGGEDSYEREAKEGGTTVYSFRMGVMEGLCLFDG